MIAGAAAGAALSLVHAVLTITLRGNQVVSGIGIVLLGTGLAAYLGDIGSVPLTSRPLTSSISPIFKSGPADLPIIGPILLGQDVLVYASWALVIGAAYYLKRTRSGLSLRAVGEDPATADSTGISVTAVRYIHVLLGGALAGVGGAYLTLALFAAWQPGISAGSGWIAFALVIFAGWRPFRALFGAYAFGALTSIGFNLQLLHIPLPLAVLSALPYVLTLVGLVLISNTALGRNATAPRALGVPSHGRRASHGEHLSEHQSQHRPAPGSGSVDVTGTAFAVGTPFAPRTESANRYAMWLQWFGYLVADVYTSYEEELEAIRTRVAMNEMSPLQKYRFTGPDAHRFTDYLVTRDLSSMEVGQVMYTPWCDDAGNTVCDGLVFRLGENDFRISGGRLALWLEQVSADFDVQVHDETADLRSLPCRGPKRLLSWRPQRVRIGRTSGFHGVARPRSAACTWMWPGRDSPASWATSYGWLRRMRSPCGTPYAKPANLTASSRPASGRSTSPGSRRGC